jgi:hypothetical protein
MKHTPLAGKPDMDALVIGPDGETFGQLKQRVRDTREATMTDASDAHVEAYGAAVAVLRAAYASVGLRYKAP